MKEQISDLTLLCRTRNEVQEHIEFLTEALSGAVLARSDLNAAIADIMNPPVDGISIQGILRLCHTGK